MLEIMLKGQYLYLEVLPLNEDFSKPIKNGLFLQEIKASSSVFLKDCGFKGNISKLTILYK